MSKHTKVEENKEVTQGVNMPEIALGVCKNPNTGSWEIVEFNYNSVTGDSRLVKRHPQSDELEAKYQLKVLLGHKGLV